jgi:hypothetical protein
MLPLQNDLLFRGLLAFLSGLRHSAHAFGAAQRRSEFEQMIHNLIIKICHQINREQDGAKRMKLFDDLVSLLRKEQGPSSRKLIQRCEIYPGVRSLPTNAV